MKALVAGGAGSAVVHAGAIVGLLFVDLSSDDVITIDLTITPPAEMAAEPAPGGSPAAPAVVPPSTAAPARVAVRMRTTLRAPRPERSLNPIAPTPTEPSLEPANEAPLPVPAPAAEPGDSTADGPTGGVAQSGPVSTAKGGGDGKATGSGTGSPGGGASSAQQAYLAKHYAYIREAIQRSAAYPALARRMGWVGRVVLAFRVLPDGAVANIRVAKGSGFQLLDVSAAEAVRRASPFPPPPAEAEIVAPVAYSLE